MKVTRIYSRYYDKSLNHYIVIVQVRRGTEYRYRTLVFNTEEEMKRVKVGDVVEEKV